MTQVVLAFDDNRLASILFGQYGQNLALIERRLGVIAEQRGNHVTVAGSRSGCEQARRVLEGLYEQIKRDRDLTQGDVEGAIRQAIAQGSLFDFVPAETKGVIVTATTFLLSVALAAMGLETDIAKLRAKGLRPLLLGLSAFLFIASFSLLLVRITT